MKRTRLFFLMLLLLYALSIGSFAAEENRIAPGAPGASSTWTSGAKTGIGTSFYEPDMGKSQSNVWFTLMDGIMTETYYPTVAQANTKALQWIVTDGKSFVDFEKTDMTHQIILRNPRSFVYRQINRDKQGHYEMIKTTITDPQNHSVVVRFTFRALRGKVSDYDLYLYLNSSVKNSGMGDTGKVVTRKGYTYLIAKEGDTALALRTSKPFERATVGYVGKSDGLKALRQKYSIRQTYQLAQSGNIAHLAKIDFGPGRKKQITFTLALGFGPTEKAAIKQVEHTLSRPFAHVLSVYKKGWKQYAKRLEKPEVGGKKQYYVAAMVLKALEDKLHPGAMIASLTIPWGQAIRADDGGVGGYHLVWARDLYQVASALISIGDEKTARRALAYLDEVQQKSDGSFPQNSWLDGTPYWGSLQMDEVAYPILLASCLGELERYESLVKPAADFIVQHGPATPQERWEEESGYSPSTIAAEIAALVVAADMAREKGDLASAAVYLATADKWAHHVEDWTVTTTGDLADHPYYIRISDTKNPDDGHKITINNGGGTHPKSNIVDAGFLELVRLGIKSADDPLITKSLNVVDQYILYRGPNGPVWYRYNHDGYGEKEGGAPYDGTGVGRPWPILTGERGEYEIALANTDHDTVPDHRFGPKNLLATMARSANEGYMIPEQVWDGKVQPKYGLIPGEGTGSATPLAWSMAQYLRLAEAIEQQKVIETPLVVKNRYVLHPPKQKHLFLHITEPENRNVTENRVTVSGQTIAGATVVALKENGTRISVRANDKGAFSMAIKLEQIGENKLTLIAYDGKRAVVFTELTLNYTLPPIVSVTDPANDDYGPGSYVYPTNPVFVDGDFDLRKFEIRTDETYTYFKLTFAHLDNPWGGPSGISKQLIDIYLDKDGLTGHGQARTKGLQAKLTPDGYWEKLIRVTGNWHGETRVYNSDWSAGEEVSVEVDLAQKTVTVRVPHSALGGAPESGWGFVVAVGGEENGGVREVLSGRHEWKFGGGSDTHRDPNILDILVPEGKTQEEVLDWTNVSPVTLPVLRIP